MRISAWSADVCASDLLMLPGLSVLERDIARVRTRVAAHVHRRLVDKLTSEQRTRLDTLVAVAEDGRQSPLDRLRDGPYLQSGPEISRAIDRLTEIRTFTDRKSTRLNSSH